MIASPGSPVHSELVYTRPPIWDVVNYNPLPWAIEHIHNRLEQFIIECVGRRGGKTTALAFGEAMKELTRPAVVVGGIRHAPLIYVVGPTASLANIIWGMVEEILLSPKMAWLEPIKNEHEGLIEIKTGACIYRKTADNPLGLQGQRVTLALLDESQDIPDMAFNRMLPSLMDAGGRLIAIGIPLGNNWFHSYWERGQLAEYTDTYSVSLPSTVNPYLNPKVISEYRNRLPDIEFRQQVLAEWAEAEGAVFHNIDPCFLGHWEEPVPGRRYVMGLDLASRHDYTVAYVVDIGRLQIVAQYRRNRLDYDIIEAQVAELYRRFNCEAVRLDATGLGEPVAHHLKQAGLVVDEFKFTNDSKAVLISTLNAEMEHGRVVFAQEDDQLRKELKLFEARLTPSNKVSYSAPEGFFDDCVFAAALAVTKALPTRESHTGFGKYLHYDRQKTWPTTIRRATRS